MAKSTMMDIKKNLRKLENRIDVLMKDTVMDGATGAKIEQLSLSGGSGKTGEVPEHSMSGGAVVDGTVEDPKKDLNSKAGSGASANEPFTGLNQGGKTFKDGSKDTKIEKCGCGKTLAKKPQAKAKGGKGGVASAKKVVPSPKKSGKK